LLIAAKPLLEEPEFEFELELRPELLLFLIWNLLFLSLNLSLKNVRHHEKLVLPFWLFLYAQLYS
jgi:hypothetical protein